MSAVDWATAAVLTITAALFLQGVRSDGEFRETIKHLLLYLVLTMGILGGVAFWWSLGNFPVMD